jgi:hypothetical protein
VQLRLRPRFVISLAAPCQYGPMNVRRGAIASFSLVLASLVVTSGPSHSRGVGEATTAANAAVVAASSAGRVASSPGMMATASTATLVSPTAKTYHTADLRTTAAYPLVGIRLDPPAAGVTAGVSAKQAVAGVCASMPCDGQQAPTRAVFAMLTDTEYAKISPTGPPVPYYVNVPSWAIYWDNATCTRQGPDRPANAPPPPISAGPLIFPCTRIIFVEAAQGTYLEAVELGGTSGLIP